MLLAYDVLTVFYVKRPLDAQSSHKFHMKSNFIEIIDKWVYTIQFLKVSE